MRYFLHFSWNYKHHVERISSPCFNIIPQKETVFIQWADINAWLDFINDKKIINSTLSGFAARAQYCMLQSGIVSKENSVNQKWSDRP